MKKEKLLQLKDNRIVIGGIVFLMALITSFQASDNPLHIGRIGTDSGVYKYVAKVILNGGMPYKDTFDHKGPLMYLVDVMGMMLNPSIGVWIMELIAIGVTFFFVYRIGRLIGCTALGSMIAVFVCALSITYFFEGGNLVEEFACPFLMISLYIFTRYFKDGDTSWYALLVCGTSFGVVCLLRVNMVALWAVMCIGVAIDCVKKKRIINIARYIVWFILGAVAVIVPVLVWLRMGKALDFFWEDYIVFNLKYSSDAERASTGNVLQAIVTFSKSTPVLFGGVLLVHYAIERKRLFDWLMVAALVLSIVAMCISGQTYGHYALILCPLIAYAFASIMGDIAINESKKELIIDTVKKNVRCRVIIIKAIILLFLIMIAVHLRPRMVFEYGGATDEIIETIKNNSGEDDKITVCGNRDWIYLRSNRQSASVYSYQEPIAEISIEIRDRYLEEIRDKKARVIVLVVNSTWKNALKTILEEDYVLIKRIDATEIYRRKE